jgi:DNA repair exonuclease SbcCD ATPase subunit
MYTDARSLWNTVADRVQNAASAAHHIQQNISSALEGIDLDAIINEDDGDTEGGPRSSKGNTMEQIEAELDSYKGLLDDAQVQLYELSKHTRVMIAEKDTELNFYKKKSEGLAPEGGENAADGGVSDEIQLELEMLRAERIVIELSLTEMQEKLKDSFHDRNEYDVLSKNHTDFMQRFESMKSDLSGLKKDISFKEVQSKETIENLVSEYSQLAAETELMTQQSEKRVAEVLLENEELATKMQSLEHAITDLADRSSSAINKSSASSSGSSSSGGGEDVSTELREVRAKLVNLQFDLKERNDEITKLKANILSSDAAGSTSISIAGGVSEAAVQEMRKEEQRKHQRETAALESEVARLKAEKEEASRQVLALQGELTTASSSSTKSINDLEAASKAAQANIDQLTSSHSAELAALKATLSELEQSNSSLHQEAEEMRQSYSSGASASEASEDRHKQAMQAS